ncbi:MAG: TIGR00341 family protein [Candidatus Thorarchaeota archaeon]|nr:TIGR00341 family protein [Candidatus Thorarchaeota archaeon]
MKQVQITVPFEKIEAVYDFLLDGLNIKNVMKFTSDNAVVLQFRIPDDSVNETIEALKSRGVGVEYGFVDILDLKASLPRESEEKTNDSKIQRDATLAVEEIYENVKKQSSLSFDYIAFIILAAVMAGFGLIQNNVTVIVASMLLSPLMGPMLAIAFGYVVRNNSLFVKGTMNEVIGIILSLSVGAVMAIVLLLDPTTIATITNDVGIGTTVTNITEITRRAGFSPIDIGVAIFSGAAVAVSVTKGDMSSLVGVAISAALMPPAVNASMMVVLGLGTANPFILRVGVGSFLLLLINIILIVISAFVMFKVKGLTSLADKSATWTAVTQFTSSSTSDLYHTRSPGATPAVDAPVATFTSVEDTTPSEPEVSTELEPESNDEEPSNG